jgi:hypothetical protein
VETIVRFFDDLFAEPGSIGILAIGILVGFLITRRILQDHALSIGDYVKLIIPYGGGGAVLAGLVGYLLENKLFSLLDAYGVGLLAGFVINVLGRILAAIIGGAADFLKKVADGIREVVGSAVEMIRKYIPRL